LPEVQFESSVLSEFASSNWKRICVFAGSQPGNAPQFQAAAVELGRKIAENGWSLVYGAGSVGLMGLIADAVLQAGGDVIGVIPDFLATKELLHPGLTQVHITEDMHTRKAKMAELSDAFIALPGGLGTFEEFFEVMTWAQLGVHSKPIGLLNSNQFYQPVVNLIDHAVETGFVRKEHRELISVAPTTNELLTAMLHHKNPDIPKWFDLDET